MTKTPNKLAPSLLLKIWAGKLERNLLTEAETKTIATLLKRVANGEDPSEVFCTNRPANRPLSDKTAEYVNSVYQKTSPFFNSKTGQVEKGLRIGAAIKAVAEEFNVSEDTVHTAYYSKQGKAVRDKLHFKP
jgi:DNA-binding NarL/FixJ family response regulator